MAANKNKNGKNMSFSGGVELGFDLDHFSSISRIRGSSPLDLSVVSSIARRSGADQIVLHLRSKSEAEVLKLCKGPGKTCLKIEPKSELVAAALSAAPSSVCLVSRIEGRPAPIIFSDSSFAAMKKTVLALKKRKIEVGVSLKAEAVSLRRARALDVDFVEICALDYAKASGQKKVKDDLAELQLAVYLASELGLKPWVACGINYKNARAVSKMTRLSGVNAGWAVAAHSILWGLKSAVSEMKILIA
jgi:pyridoxine 5'-phosphate synthase PdxJ